MGYHNDTQLKKFAQELYDLLVESLPAELKIHDPYSASVHIRDKKYILCIEQSVYLIDSFSLTLTREDSYRLFDLTIPQRLCTPQNIFSLVMDVIGADQQ